MKRSRYSFVDLTSKAQKEIFDEIKIAENNLDDFEEKIIDEEIKEKMNDGKYIRPGSYLDELMHGATISSLEDKYTTLIHKYNDLLKGNNTYHHAEIIL